MKTDLPILGASAGINLEDSQSVTLSLDEEDWSLVLSLIVTKGNGSKIQLREASGVTGSREHSRIVVPSSLSYRRLL
jgi:hypothetical protein